MAGAIQIPYQVQDESSLRSLRGAACGRCVVPTVIGTRCRSCASDVQPRSSASTAIAPLFGFIDGMAARLVTLAVTVSICAGAIAYSWTEGDRDRFMIRAIVYGGLLVSLSCCNRQFSHSLVAYLGGDREIKARGFLTLNPLKFMDPVYSIAIPVLFTLMGGIPIMGGRTLIDDSSLRSRWWHTAVSLAGPGANVLVAVAIAGVFRLGLLDEFGPVAAGLAYLGVLQIALAMFNLIPVPPLDGFGFIARTSSARRAGPGACDGPPRLLRAPCGVLDVRSAGRVVLGPGVHGGQRTGHPMVRPGIWLLGSAVSTVKKSEGQSSLA